MYLTRWIPVDERKTRKRAVPRPPSAPRVSSFVKGGAVGLAVLATARWLLRNPPGAGQAADVRRAPADADPAAGQDRDDTTAE